MLLYWSRTPFFIVKDSSSTLFFFFLGFKLHFLIQFLPDLVGIKDYVFMRNRPAIVIGIDNFFELTLKWGKLSDRNFLFPGGPVYHLMV